MNNIIELLPYLPTSPVRRKSRYHAIATGISIAVESIVTIILAVGILAGLVIGLSIL